MQRATILLINDDFEALATISTQLLSHTALQCTVHTAMSASSALEAATLFQPNCIIIDFSNPSIDAHALLAMMARRGRTSPAIIALVLKRDNNDAFGFMRLGVRDVIQYNEIAGNRLLNSVTELVFDGDLQQRLSKAEERESETAKRLESAYRSAQFLAVSGQRFGETLDYEETLDLIGLIACPFLGDVCILDLYSANILYRRSITLADNTYPNLKGTLAHLTPSIDAAIGVPLALRNGRLGFYEGQALVSVGRDDADVAELRRAGMRRLTVVPLIAGGRTLGAMSLGSTESNDEHESLRVSTYEQFARITSVAIENSRMLREANFARTQAESAKRRLSFQSRVSGLLSRSLRWQTTLERLVKLFTLSICDTAEIYLVDDDRRLRLAALASTTPAVAELVTTLRKRYPPQFEDEAGAGHVARTGRSKIHAEDVIQTVRNHAKDPNQYEMYAQWAPVSSVLAPFLIDGRVAGVISAIRDRSGLVMGYDDLTLVEDVGRRLASYLYNARLFEKEHSIASALQRSLLPKRLPQVQGLRIASRYLAGSVGIDVGGDWYDVLDVSADHIAIMIGDVVGRGVVAAATMGQLRNLLRAYAFEDISPAKTLERVNELLLRTGDERYATVVIMRYNPATYTITYASAGHPAPIVIDPGGMPHMLGGTVGLPVGAWPGATYEEHTVGFPPGSTLILYTDGLVETRERDMHSGILRLAEHLINADTEPETLADDLLTEFAPDRSDDTAILVVRSLTGNEYLRRRWSTPSLDALTAMALRIECMTFLRQFTLDENGLFAASLVLGELLGNVARHASGEAFVFIDWRGDDPLVTIGDRGPGLKPSIVRELKGDLFRESGRGLALIRHHVSSLEFKDREGGGTQVDTILQLRKTDTGAHCLTQ